MSPAAFSLAALSACDLSAVLSESFLSAFFSLVAVAPSEWGQANAAELENTSAIAMIVFFMEK